MLRFFRQIRQKLILQENMKKYIFYAIGEIFLVVIGILIALQVNNWNEERIQQQKLNDFFISFRTDLIQDLTLIQENLDSLEKNLNELRSFKSSMSSPQVTKDTLVEIASSKFMPFIYGGISFNDNTINSPIAADMLSLVESTFRSDIVELNELKRMYTTQIVSDIAIYVQRASTFSQQYPFNAPGHMIPDTYLSQQIWEQSNWVELGAAMNGLYGFKYAIELRAYDNLNKILTLTKSLAAQLETIE